MRVGVIAAAGASSRTGLGQYTTKAALPIGDHALIWHQLDFVRRSGVDRVIVIAQPRHVALLWSLLSPEDRTMTTFVISDAPSGWAGDVERALPLLADDDQVLLISCDNYHTQVESWLLPGYAVMFTYVKRDESETPAPPHILARGATVRGASGQEGTQWSARGGEGFSGNFFAGYAIVRGEALRRALRVMQSVEGKKEMTALLALLVSGVPSFTLAYPGTYCDIVDISALARVNARVRDGDTGDAVEIGAGVVLRSGPRHVFLTERADGHGWVPPGGIVDSGESFAHAAIRETQEETGLVIHERDLRLLGVYPSKGKVGEAACTVVFHAEVPCGQTPHAACREVTRVGRFTREEAALLRIPFGLDAAVADLFLGRELDTRSPLGGP